MWCCACGSTSALVDRDPTGRICPAGIRGRYRRSSLRAVGARGRAHAENRDLVAASAELGAAVDLWRGPPLPELCEWPPGRSEAPRLEEIHRCVTEELAELELACGHHHQWIPVLESLVSEEPLRERRWALLMVALYRCGRQADAFRVPAGTRGPRRRRPGARSELVRLEQRVGARDKSLEHDSHEPRRPRPNRRRGVGKETEVAVPSGTVTFLFTDLEGSTPLVAARRRQRWKSPSPVISRFSTRRSLGSTVRAQDNGRWRVRGLLVGCRGVRAATTAQRALVAERWHGGVPLSASYGPAFGRGSGRGRRLPRAGTEPGLTADGSGSRRSNRDVARHGAARTRPAAGGHRTARPGRAPSQGHRTARAHLPGNGARSPRRVSVSPFRRHPAGQSVLRVEHVRGSRPQSSTSSTSC